MEPTPEACYHGAAEAFGPDEVEMVGERFRADADDLIAGTLAAMLAAVSEIRSGTAGGCRRMPAGGKRRPAGQWRAGGSPASTIAGLPG
jgi:hypothetical protein